MSELSERRPSVFTKKWVRIVTVIGGLSLVASAIVVPVAIVLANKDETTQLTQAELEVYMNETLTVSLPAKIQEHALSTDLDALLEEIPSYTKVLDADTIKELGITTNLLETKPKGVTVYYGLDKQDQRSNGHYLYTLTLKGRTGNGKEADRHNETVIETADTIYEKSVSQAELKYYVDNTLYIGINDINAHLTSTLDHIVFLSKNFLPFDQQAANDMGLIAEFGEKPDAISLFYKLTVIKNVVGQPKEYSLTIKGVVENLAPYEKIMSVQIVSSDDVDTITTEDELTALVGSITKSFEDVKDIIDIEDYVTPGTTRLPFSSRIFDEIGITSNFDTLNIPSDVRFEYTLHQVGESVIGEKNEYRITLYAETVSHTVFVKSKATVFESADVFHTTSEALESFMNEELTLTLAQAKTFEELDDLIESTAVEFTSAAANERSVETNLDALEVPADVQLKYTFKVSTQGNTLGTNKIYVFNVIATSDSGITKSKSINVFSSDTTYKEQNDVTLFINTLTLASTENKLIAQLEAYATASMNGADFNEAAIYSLGLTTNLYGSLAKPQDLSVKYYLTRVGAQVQGRANTYTLKVEATSLYTTSFSAHKSITLTSSDKADFEQKEFDAFMGVLSVSAPTTANKTITELDALVAGSTNGATFDADAIASLGVVSNLETVISAMPSTMNLKYKLVVTKNQVTLAKEYSLVVYAISTVVTQTSSSTKAAITLVSSDIVKTSQTEIEALLASISASSPFAIKTIAELDVYLTTEPTTITRAIAEGLGIDTNVGALVIPADVIFKYTLVKQYSVAGEEQDYEFQLFIFNKNDDTITAEKPVFTISSRDIVASTQSELQAYLNSIVVTEVTPKTIAELDEIVSRTSQWKPFTDETPDELGITFDSDAKAGDVILLYKLTQNTSTVAVEKTYNISFEAINTKLVSATRNNVQTLTSSDIFKDERFKLEEYMSTVIVAFHNETKTIEQLEALVTSTETTPETFDADAATDLGLNATIPTLIDDVELKYIVVRGDVVAAGQKAEYKVIITGTNTVEEISVSLPDVKVTSIDFVKTTQAELDALTTAITISPATLPNREISRLDAILEETETPMTLAILTELGVSSNWERFTIPADVAFKYTLVVKTDIVTQAKVYTLTVVATTTDGLESEITPIDITSSDVHHTSKDELDAFVESITIANANTKTYSELDALVSINWMDFDSAAQTALGITVTSDTPNSDINIEYKIERAYAPSAGNRVHYIIKYVAWINGKPSISATGNYEHESSNNYVTPQSEVSSLLDGYNVQRQTASDISTLKNIATDSMNWPTLTSTVITALGIVTNINVANIPSDIVATYKLVSMGYVAGQKADYSLTIKFTLGTYEVSRTFIVTSFDTYSTTQTDLDAYINSLSLSINTSTKTYSELDLLTSGSWASFDLAAQSSLGVITSFNPLTLPSDITLTYDLNTILKTGGRNVSYELIIKGSVNGTSLTQTVRFVISSSDKYSTTQEDMNRFNSIQTESNTSTSTFDQLQTIVQQSQGNWQPLTTQSLDALGISFSGYDLSSTPIDVLIEYKIELIDGEVDHEAVYRFTVRVTKTGLTTITKIFYILSSDHYETSDAQVQNMINNIRVSSIRGGTWSEFDSRQTLNGEERPFIKSEFLQLRMNVAFPEEHTKPVDTTLKYTFVARPGRAAGKRVEYSLVVKAYIRGRTTPLISEKLVTSQDLFIEYSPIITNAVASHTINVQSTKSVAFLDSKRTDIMPSGYLQFATSKPFTAATITELGITVNANGTTLPSGATYKYDLVKKKAIYGSKAEYLLGIVMTFAWQGNTHELRKTFVIHSSDEDTREATFIGWVDNAFINDGDVYYSITEREMNGLELEMKKDMNGWLPVNQQLGEKYGFYNENASFWRNFPSNYDVFIRNWYSGIGMAAEYKPEFGNVIHYDYLIKIVKKQSAPATLPASKVSVNDSHNLDVRWNTGANSEYEINAILELNRIFEHGSHTYDGIELYNNYFFALPTSGRVKPTDLSDTSISVIEKILPESRPWITTYQNYINANKDAWLNVNGQYPSYESPLTFKVEAEKTVGNEVFYVIKVSSRNIKDFAFQISVVYNS